MEYEILKYRPELKKDILDLQTYLWSPDLALNAAYFEWKYDQNPYIDQPLIHVAVYKGQVVGMRGLMGAAWQRDGATQVEVCPCAADVVIHPQHRNRGLFETLTRAALQEAAHRGYPFAFNLSGARVTVMSLLAMGWRSVGKLHTMYWCSPVKKVLKSIQTRARKLLKREPAIERNVFHVLDLHGKGGSPITGARVSVQQTACPDEMFGLVNRIQRRQGLRHTTDPQYLAWRFRNPLANYRFLFWTGDQLEGYIALQSSVTRARPWIGVVDWAVANMQVWADLLKAAMRWGRFSELRIWSSTLSEEERAVLLEVGFRDLHEGSMGGSLQTILVTSTTAESQSKDWGLNNESLLELPNWNVRMIDSDNF
ncbi:MAG: GNAT family N-acetyltransferase [Nitrospirae bacterium]|nr:GNAT family N-acetyltransferase [Nitrospirota bacterium]